MEWTQRDFTVSDDLSRMDTNAIYAMLSASYWAGDRPRHVLELAMQHSLCFGLFHGQEQIGFARVITDHATFAWLCDVIIHPDYRGQGLGKWVVDCALRHPSVQVRTFGLGTRDAHGLYEQFGFKRHENMLRRQAAPEAWEESDQGKGGYIVGD